MYTCLCISLRYSHHHQVALYNINEYFCVFQLFIKVFCSDGSAKSFLVDETMSVAYLTKLLAEKCHVTMDPKWALVETIPELYMGMSS